MKKFFIMLFLLLAAFVALVFTAPFFLDDAAFEKRFVENFEAVTGRKVAVDGEFRIRVFPSPSLDVQKVRIIASEDAQDTDLLYVERLNAELDLTNFLFGGVQVTRAKLINPVINLEITPEGEASWMMDFFRTPDMQLAGDNYIDKGVSLKSVDIENGILNFKDTVSGFSSTISGLYGDFVADTLRGPYRFDGNFSLFGETTSLAVSLDRLQEQNPSEFNVMIAKGDAESSLSMSGSLMVEGGKFNMSGNISVEIGKPLLLFSDILAKVKLAEDFSNPMAANLSFAVTKGQIKITDIVFKQGDASAVGDGVFLLTGANGDENTRRLSMSFIANKFKLDPILELIYAASEGETPLQLPRSAVFGFKSDVLGYKGGEVKNLAFKLDMDGDKITMKNIEATLPANATVKAQLAFVRGNGNGVKVATSGNVEFETQNFGEVAKWLSLPLLKDAKADSLLTARMTANVNGAGSVVSFDDLFLRVGTVSVTGSVGTDLSLPRDNVLLDIRVSDLDLEKYVVAKGQESPNKEAAILEQMQEILFDTAERLKVLNDFDVSGKIDVSRLSYGSKQIGRIIADVALKDGVLEVKELKASNLAGGTLGLTGALSGFGTNNLKLKDVVYTARLVNVASFLDEVGAGDLFDTIKFSNMQTEGTVNGDANSLSFKTTFESSGLNVSADGWLFLPFGKEATGRFQFAITQANAHNFMKLLAASYDLPQGFNGGVAIKGDASVKTGLAVIKDFDFMLGNERAVGALRLAKGNYIFNLSSDIVTATKYYIADSRAVSNKLGFGQYVAAFARNNNISAAWKVNKLIVDNDIFDDVNINAKVSDGKGNIAFKSLLGKGTVDASANMFFEGNTPVFSGNLAVKNMAFKALFPIYSVINVTAESADVKSSFRSFGRSVKELKDSVVADGQFVLQNGEIRAVGLNRAYTYLQDASGFDEKSADAFAVVFKTSDASYETAKGNFKMAGGRVAVTDGVISYMKGQEAKFEANYNMADKSVNARLAVDFAGDMPSYKVAITGAVDNPVYAFDNKQAVEVAAAQQKLQNESASEREARKQAEDLQKAKEAEARRISFDNALKDVKMAVAKAYKQASDADKMGVVATGMESIITSTKAVAEKMVAEFATLVDVSAKSEISDDDIALVGKVGEKLKEPIRQIEQNYGQVVMVAAKKLTKDYADSVAKFAEYAKSMDKANPYLPEVSAAAKIVDDANYDTQMALRIVNETKIYKDAEDAVSRAKRAYDKSKAAVDSIVKATGYTEGL